MEKGKYVQLKDERGIDTGTEMQATQQTQKHPAGLPSKPPFTGGTPPTTTTTSTATTATNTTTPTTKPPGLGGGSTG